jgi:4-hydroxybenzoate polyprenyltransferase
MFERLVLYARLARFDRPIGWLLLLWPTLWALWVAGEGRPQPWNVLVFITGVIVMRGAGCVINDYADRDFDPQVARTKNRPLALGDVSSREALVVFALLSAVAFCLVLTLNRLTILLSLVGVFLAVTYPFLKRFTHLPQLYLGVAFSWGIPMAFAAERGEVPMLAWIILLANLLWTVAYDTMYAMSDRPDDVRIGVKSTAILFGRFDLVAVGTLQCAAIATLAIIGGKLGLNGYYYVGLAVAALIACYQLYLCRSRDRDKCLQAFLNNTWLGGVIFTGLVLAYL